MNVAYVRVSSADQHEDRQLKALEPYGIEKYFIEQGTAEGGVGVCQGRRCSLCG